MKGVEILGGSGFEPIISNLSSYTGVYEIGDLSIECFQVTIKPSAASTPTKTNVTFSNTYEKAPAVFTTNLGSVPGTTVLGCSASGVTTTGCEVYITRTNTTNTIVQVLVVGKKA